MMGEQEPPIGTDHCRVAPPVEQASTLERLQYFRHLFGYVEAAKRLAPSQKWLEIGSGEGYGAHYLAGCGAHLIATDLSIPALRHAARHYERASFCQTLGTTLPFPDRQFDVVVSFQVIEHIKDVMAYLREAQRVLRPGGQMLLTTPNRHWRLLPLQRPWNPYHVREYSAWALQRILAAVFSEVEICGVVARPDLMALERTSVRQNPWRVYPAMLRWAVRKRLPPAVLPKLIRPAHLMDALADFMVARRIPRTPQADALTVALSDFALSPAPNVGMDLFAVVHVCS